jgi:hypothetical protein
MADPSEPATDDSKTKRRGGGGKLSRSETVTVRLDPKLRYLAELAARKQRRTLSSFIEWAIEESLKSIKLNENDERDRSIALEGADLWDVDEPDRFARLAYFHPHMLTHDEQVLWKLIQENSFFWRRNRKGYLRSDLIFDRLRKHWAALCSVARGTADKAILPRGDTGDETTKGDFEEME